MNDLTERLELALVARQELIDEDPQHEGAWRLFNGFYEGYRDLAVDVYAKTAVVHNYAKLPADGEAAVAIARQFIMIHLPWIEAILLKTRKGASAEAKNGILIYGEKLDTSVREHGLRYAIDLTMNRDASLYLDTRELRQWLIDNSEGKTVLNTFAYTGSLGTAAMSGGAKQVVQTDLNKKFLNVAKTSYTLNGFPINKKDFLTGDFFSVIKQFKNDNARFDIILLDPPFFSTTGKGNVDLSENIGRLINRLRPLVNEGGKLIAINNALFVSGDEYSRELKGLAEHRFVRFLSQVDVPADFTGYKNTRVDEPITDPAPFNHSTKIAVLDIWHKRKVGRGER
jgi:23S rRNA (cytosine1962-C5)-methyltransferase